jgi:hypothetical protein
LELSYKTFLSREFCGFVAAQVSDRGGDEKKMCERKEREYAQYAAPETDLLAIFHNPFCITQNFFVSNMYNLTQQQWQEISIR